MSTERKGKLLELGADRLADALLELAGRDEFADDLVERLIATPQDNIGRFRAKLSVPPLPGSRRTNCRHETAAGSDRLLLIRSSVWGTAGGARRCW